MGDNMSPMTASAVGFGSARLEEELLSPRGSPLDRNLSANVINQGPEGAMNLSHITQLYTDASTKLVLLGGVETIDLHELLKDVSSLRELIACVVCDKLVPTDFVINSGPTEACFSPHLRCIACADKDWIQPCDLHSNVPLNVDGDDHQYLRLIVESYKGFCSAVIKSPECRTILEEKAQFDPELDVFALIDLLTEGALASMTASSQSDATDEVYQEADDMEPLERESQIEIENSLSDIDIDDNYPTSPPPLTLLENPHVEPTSPPPTLRLFGIPPNPVEFNAQGSASLNPQDLFQFSNHNASWPDLHHVLRYASGTVQFPIHNANYTMPLPISLHECMPDFRLVKAPLPLETSDRLVEASTVVNQQIPKVEERQALEQQRNSFETKQKVASKAPRKGCRCGNATIAPGKLTCCGQRCPCYVAGRLCVDCRCKGCRNPHQVDGKKLLLPRGSQINQSTTVQNSYAVSTVSTSASATLTFQTIPDVQPTTSKSEFSMGPLTYTTYPLPYQLPISIVGLPPILQPTTEFNINKF